ncbi:MAG: hypothetical protein EBZ48_02935 [Proteobacteria bacterium]|nr:hypothetical protein [Pseudomonadota bacterium]
MTVDLRIYEKIRPLLTLFVFISSCEATLGDIPKFPLDEPNIAQTAPQTALRRRVEGMLRGPIELVAIQILTGLVAGASTKGGWSRCDEDQGRSPFLKRAPASQAAGWL